MLMEVLAFGGVTGAWSAEVGSVPAGWPTAGLMATGDGDLANEDAGVGTVVTVVDLLGAGLMGGTFMDDIMTTGLVAGTVFTTTEELDLAGSNKDNLQCRL